MTAPRSPMPGRVYGRLTVLRRVDAGRHTSRYLCRCDCGRECKVGSGSLNSGERTACTACVPPGPRSHPGPPGPDMMGLAFGRLTVVARAAPPAGLARKVGAWWLCRCACGETCVCRAVHLRAGKRKSCGRMRCSRPKM